MRLLATCVVGPFIGALLAAAAQAEPHGLRVGDSLIVEVISTLDTSEVWHLSLPETHYTSQGTAPGGVVGVWTYDAEEARIDGEWWAACIVMDGIGDLDEQPVAIRVWAKGKQRVVVKEVKPLAGLASAFRIGVGKAGFILTHTPMGVVRVDETEIGKIS